MNAFPGFWHGCGHNPGQEGSCWSLRALRSGSQVAPQVQWGKVLCCSQGLALSMPPDRWAATDQPPCQQALMLPGLEAPIPPKTERANQIERRNQGGQCWLSSPQKERQGSCKCHFVPASPSERRQRGSECSGQRAKLARNGSPECEGPPAWLRRRQPRPNIPTLRLRTDPEATSAHGQSRGHLLPARQSHQPHEDRAA